MSKYPTEDHDEDEDDYLTKVPARYQKVIQKPKQQLTRWPEEWD